MNGVVCLVFLAGAERPIGGVAFADPSGAAVVVANDGTINFGVPKFDFAAGAGSSTFSVELGGGLYHVWNGERLVPAVIVAAHEDGTCDFQAPAQRVDLPDGGQALGPAPAPYEHVGAPTTAPPAGSWWTPLLPWE